MLGNLVLAALQLSSAGPVGLATHETPFIELRSDLHSCGQCADAPSSVCANAGLDRGRWRHDEGKGNTMRLQALRSIRLSLLTCSCALQDASISDMTGLPSVCQI